MTGLLGEKLGASTDLIMNSVLDIKANSKRRKLILGRLGSYQKAINADIIADKNAITDAQLIEDLKSFKRLEVKNKKIRAKDKKIKNYDPKILKKLVKASVPVVLELKEYFNRPRPKVSARKMNIKMKDMEMASMKTSSYPSGHSTQGVLIAKVLSDKYPEAKKEFEKAAKNISYSRRVAHAHYKSDSKMGELLGNAMYNHVKNKI